MILNFYMPFKKIYSSTLRIIYLWYLRSTHKIPISSILQYTVYPHLNAPGALNFAKNLHKDFSYYFVNFCLEKKLVEWRLLEGGGR